MFAFAISLQALLYPATHIEHRRQPVTLGVVTDLIRGDAFYWGSLMAGVLFSGVPVAAVFTLFLDLFVKALPAPRSSSVCVRGVVRLASAKIHGASRPRPNSHHDRAWLVHAVVRCLRCMHRLRPLRRPRMPRYSPCR
jgi:hypothetical protein